MGLLVVKLQRSTRTLSLSVPHSICIVRTRCGTLVHAQRQHAQMGTLCQTCHAEVTWS